MANNNAEKNSQGDSNLFGFLGILLPIIGFIIVKLGRPKDDYALYYSKQGLVLGIASIAISILQGVLLALSFITFGIAEIIYFITYILYLPLFIFWIMGMIYAFSEEKKDLPIIGNIAKKF